MSIQYLILIDEIWEVDCTAHSAKVIPAVSKISSTVSNLPIIDAKFVNTTDVTVVCGDNRNPAFETIVC